MSDIQYEYTSGERAASFNTALDTVARERKYLAKVEGHPLEQSQGFINYLIENNFAQFFAVKDDRVIGWCDATPVNYDGMQHVAVVGMGVLAEYRGRGIGGELLERCIQHAQDHNGVQRIELEVFRSNTGAIEFYKKHGFTIEGEKIKARYLDGVWDNLVVMGRLL
jgi:ribosomal protein S18 acetylase RimI-like enzyme